MHQCLKLAVLGMLAVAPASMAIAGSKSPKLTRCDGKQRRPANIYGSILPTVDPASGTVMPASAPRNAIDVFPQADPAKPNPPGNPTGPADKPGTQVPPIGAISLSTNFRSC